MSDFDQYKYVDTIPKSVKIKRAIWNIVWLIAFRPTPRWAFHAWRRTLLRLFGAKIGKGSKISPSCFVWAPWNLEMGDYSALGDNVDCYTMNKIIIGSKVAVSQRSFLCTGSHAIDTLLRPLITSPIVIHNHAWIAAECFIHPGVTIGEGTVVGARSVVVKDLPSWMICTGHPCKPLKTRELKKP
ncbi:putative colanic acid biosynthesis acetyltransferase [Agitococcus lubricus]|uniref:Putative colanic acid biosynthesis acetyltransferase WcaF n=1 Tax=Agitococcus lubricus TaxID=1077255 RepID=A0A2T5J0H8_9GAMM|nr:putative colanic acid biosynthesis acetyltransferase [Agitococcus lubricus]PTQ89771.1 putative colanic acid biosynthesis acetyltransferase WcaF [Agitococcus lubricus]